MEFLMGPTRITVRVKDGKARIVFGKASKRTIKRGTDIYRGDVDQMDRALMIQAAERAIVPVDASGG